VSEYYSIALAICLMGVHNSCFCRACHCWAAWLIIRQSRVR